MKYHNQRINIVKELGDKSGEQDAYSDLANAYLGIGDFKRAIDYYMQLLRIAKEAGNKAKEQNAYYKLGIAHETSHTVVRTTSWYS